jgi:hypothetical protein
MCGYENKLEDKGHEKLKYNNHEMKAAESFKYIGSKMVTNEVSEKKLQKE